MIYFLIVTIVNLKNKIANQITAQITYFVI